MLVTHLNAEMETHFVEIWKAVQEGTTTVSLEYQRGKKDPKRRLFCPATAGGTLIDRARRSL